jgi:phosphoenolpyruvate-protein kinase (PTS system EI component)
VLGPDHPDTLDTRRNLAHWRGLAGDPAAAVLLAGLGVRELSMAPPLIPEVKQALRSVTIERARELADAALEAADAAAARLLAAQAL